MQTRKTIFIGRFVSAPSPDKLLLQEGAVVVSSQDGRGIIEKVDWTIKKESEAIERFGVEAAVVRAGAAGFFIPGFIDTHIHAPQYPNAGIFGKSTLLDWLKTYTFPLESSLGSTKSPMYKNGVKPNPLDRARQIYSRVISRTLSYGTTAACYFATIDVPATNLLTDLAFQKGQRAYIGRVCMDHPETCPDYYRDETPDESLKNSEESIRYCQQLDPTGELLAPTITPRFALSCQSETMKRLGKLAKEKQLRVHTHISENVFEIAEVKRLFPEQKSYSHVYDAHDLLTDKAILAHAIHLSDEEMELIKQRKSKVSHCPASNSALGSGICPVRKLLDKGIEVGLGTDVSGGYSMSILEAVRQACLVSRLLGQRHDGDKKWNIGVTEGLWLATVGGAKVIGMDGRLGGFQEGMLWDVQEISLGQVDNQGQGMSEAVDIFGWETWEERIDKWVWNGDDRNVKKVWVGGRLVHS